MFEGVDFEHFWEEDPESVRMYRCEPCTDEIIRDVEEKLGYKLPEAYVSLMKQSNGGRLVNQYIPLSSYLPGVGNHAMILQLYGIGCKGSFSIAGLYGTQFLIEEWGFPPIGVAIGEGFFGCHETYFLDYRACGPQGEPKVSHVDQECDYRITVVAENFEEFVRCLRPNPAE